MKASQFLCVASVVLSALTLPASNTSAATLSGSGTDRPLVQIALLLDTSGSMEGLIEQAKGQLWKIVNEFINAKQNGRRPELQVALFEYGKSSLPASEGYLRQIVGLTTDLDKLSEELFALKTNGGDEYCGWVIREAVARLAWSTSPDVYRVIFIAGNEPFTQGAVDYRQSCKAAIEKGIIVNTIHCGDEATGIATQWQDGAFVAEGKYLFIDHNRAVVHFEAPQDREIARLGAELNKTYLAYGLAGRERAARQVQQDVNAMSFSAQGAVLNRAVAKASANYRNENWDLVDAAGSKPAVLNELKAEELPAEMQKMNATDRKAYVETKAKQRAEIQATINQLNAERAKFVAAQMKNQTATNTLDAAMISAIRQQAAKQNYKFE